MYFEPVSVKIKGINLIFQLSASDKTIGLRVIKGRVPVFLYIFEESELDENGLPFGINIFNQLINILGEIGIMYKDQISEATFKLKYKVLKKLGLSPDLIHFFPPS